MGYVYQGKTAQVALTDRELTLARAALVFHTESQSHVEQSRSESLMGQIQRATDKPNQNSEGQLVRVDAATCETLKRGLDELKGRPQYGESDMQTAIAELSGRIGETRQELTGENKQQRAQTDDVRARAEERLTARLSAANGPAEARLPGFERPYQLQFSEITRPASGGRGR